MSQNYMFDGMEDGGSASPSSEAYGRLFIEWVVNQPTGASYTSEDITAEIGMPSGRTGQNRNNSVGSLMAAAAKMGLHQRIRYQQANKENQHGTSIGVWHRTEKHQEEDLYRDADAAVREQSP